MMVEVPKPVIVPTAAATKVNNTSKNKLMLASYHSYLVNPSIHQLPLTLSCLSTIHFSYNGLTKEIADVSMMYVAYIGSDTDLPPPRFA